MENIRQHHAKSGWTFQECLESQGKTYVPHVNTYVIHVHVRCKKYRVESVSLGRRMPWANRLFSKSMKG